MKNALVGVSFLFALLFSTTLSASENIWRFPEVSENFFQKMEEFRGNTTTNPWVSQECMWSSETSSAHGDRDYFVVGSQNPDGGRIVVMEPLITSFYGVIEKPVFRDAVNNTVFPVEFATQDLRNGLDDREVNEEGMWTKFFHHGSFQMEEETVYFIIGYKGGMRYPAVILTWGEDSNVGEPGYTVDDFANALTPIPDYPTNQVVLQNVCEGNPNGDMPGLYVLVGSDKHVELEKSQDFKSWESTQPPVLIYGRLTAFFFDTPSSGLGFFRAKMRE